MTALAVAIWMWGSDVAGGYGGPAELNTGPNGHSYIQIQNYLVEHDVAGEYLATHNLEHMDVELFLGGFAFFSNGDILLRRGPDTRSFLDNVRAYKREANRNSIVPESPDSGLFRCNLDTRTCERFGQEGIDFKAAYSVYIDRSSDEVYISDTTRHLLRKYSSDGVELAAPAGGFKFPNQLVLHDGQVLVADTNHHVIRQVEARSSTYAETVDTKYVVPAEATNAQQTWPSHFARVGEEWWVNNMQTGMNNGGLYVFDDDWQYVRRVDLPPDADPISILAVGGSVWVSDWNNDVVRRFSTTGEPLADLESAGLEAILESSRQERFKYAILSYAGVAAVVLLFVGLTVRALVLGLGKARNQHSAAEVRAASNTLEDSLHLEPDEKMRKRTTKAIVSIVVLLLLAVVALILSFNLVKNPEFVRLLVIPFAGLFAIVVLMIWINRANWGTSVSVDGNTVTLTDHTGRQSRCPIGQVRYDNTAIATRDVLVILGLPNAQIYNRTAVRDQLLPRLAEAQKVGPFEMLKLQVQLGHPQGIVVVLGLLALAVYGAVRLVS